MDTAVSTRLKAQRSVIERQIGARDVIQKRLAELETEVLRNSETAKLADAALRFVEDAIRTTRIGVLRDAERVVNEALKSVYGDDAPRLECEVGVKRDRSSVVPWIIKRCAAGEVRRTADGFGCGVGDIVSLSLRLVLLHASGAEKVLVADEPFRFLGVVQVPRASALLREISHRLNVQTIMTTHHDATVEAADAAFCLTMNDDTVILRKETNNAEKS